MRSPSFLVAPLLVVALALGGCDRRARECEALRRVAEAAPLGDAGMGDGAQAVDRALAAIDAIEPRTPELAGARGDYRAAVVSLAEAARRSDAVVREIFAAVPPAEGAPTVDPALGATLSERFQVLAEPCMGDMLAGLGSLFQKGPAPMRRPRPDCEKLQGVLVVALRPVPGSSVAAHAQSVAVALEGANLDEAPLAEAARSFAALIRQLDPVLARVKLPAVELLALGVRFAEARRGLEDARARATELAGAVQKACPAR